MSEQYNYFPEWRSDDYYFVADDFRKYPDAWCYVVWSRRGPGKTYSLLRWTYENGIPLVYMRRTNKDVGFICNNKYGVDMSPYVPICRDTGATITPLQISDGIGAFYDHVDEKGKPEGTPFAYCISLNAIKDVKGIELSFADIVVLDEFIPQTGEIVRYTEGSQLLSVYMTIQRDRAKRGKKPSKLVLFANAENISTPITNTLEIVDDMVNLSASGETHLYLENRGIILHHITNDEIPLQREELTGIYKAMEGTQWGMQAFGGEFAGNDFTNVKRVQMKNYKPVCMYHYKNKDTYIYRNQNGEYYFTYSKANTPNRYNLDRENERQAFFYNRLIDIRDALMEDKVKTESYTMYDLIVNYKKIFSI